MTKKRLPIMAVTIPFFQPATGSDLPGKIQSITQMLLMLVSAVAILFIIVGGFQFILSAGDKERAKRARNTIIYSIIGLVVVFLSYVIIAFVIKQLK